MNWFSLTALWLIQRFNKENKDSLGARSLEEIFFGVPQGSILGALLSNTFFCDLFSRMNDVDFENYNKVAC